MYIACVYSVLVNAAVVPDTCMRNALLSTFPGNFVEIFFRRDIDHVYVYVCVWGGGGGSNYCQI